MSACLSLRSLPQVDVHAQTFSALSFMLDLNLVPRVLSLFGQRLVERRDSGVLEFYYRRISAVKQLKPLRG